ncbi:Hpt domain-containing protein [Aliivibrio finisterrensis]|uniref:Hpt domain-containing protein n=1 Tax=Aliivibrio finisterrensis TaxID=511998 RepID=A0A6N6RWA3_9GAMM|nr:Hpt domain-containing protein [Aliivibrio finisterrensis]KAB2826034.1 Hpt domain-containing protein [Aliivibrio finisterrensis]
MINLKKLEEMFEEEHEFIQQLFQLYLDEHQSVPQLINAQYSADNRTALFHTLHTLKGALSSLCEESVISDIEKSEIQLKNNLLPSSESINNIITGLNKVSLQIEEFLA